MGDVLSVRIDDQLSRVLESFLHEKKLETIGKLEKSEAVRQLILKGIYMTAIQSYLEHKISIQKAAAMCLMPLSEFMDFLAQMGIGGQLDLEDILIGYEHLQKLN